MVSLFHVFDAINRPAQNQHLRGMVGRQSNSLPSQGSDKAGLVLCSHSSPELAEKKIIRSILICFFLQFSLSKSASHLPTNLHCIFRDALCTLYSSTPSSHSSPVFPISATYGHLQVHPDSGSFSAPRLSPAGAVGLTKRRTTFL